jgi:nucleoside triphosphatase YtkD
MRLREVLPYKTVEEAQAAGIYIEAAIIVPFMGDKMVMCDNRWRGWEFPGGGVEWGETVLHAARRELREETGAEFSDLEFVNVIWLERGTWRSFKAALYFAEVSALRHSFDYYEIDEVRVFDSLPEQRYMSFACEGELYQLALAARNAKAKGEE